MSDNQEGEAEEKSHWPEEAFPLGEVRAWVAPALGLPADTPLSVAVVYASYAAAPDFRLTARLTYRDEAGDEHDVVFKGNRFPLLSGSARAHALVSRHCPGSVPHLLACEDDEAAGSCRLIYRAFEGAAVGSRDPALLVATARALAKIQRAVAARARRRRLDFRG